MNLDIVAWHPLGLLTLMQIKGIGPHATDRIVRQFQTLREVFEASGKVLERTVPAAARAAVKSPAEWQRALDSARRTLDDAETYGVTVLSAFEASYPEWLRELPDRPPVLYVKGRLRPGRRYVATIGTREPSRFGEEVTQRIVSVLASKQWSIVSGLALGVDALSHRAALDAQAHTVAVLANGLETVYPKKNSHLAQEILESGGALISEQPFGAPAIPRNLVQRDRIQSGMSAGTVVMQTDIVGGSMHTVRFTLRQHRLLFAPVPGGEHAKEPKSQGTLALATVDGRELSKKLRADGDYLAMLTTVFARRPVAHGLASRDDYQKLLELLDAKANGSTSEPTANNAQLGLF
ncbi:MAG TPA: DNA-processing protein DprA [Candidatus Paceibacterota bacterium]|nr:DNA-processing protein DprA [Candidatus Paceibacterota bacterium]